jgi:hypothetical protein
MYIGETLCRRTLELNAEAGGTSETKKSTLAYSSQRHPNTLHRLIVQKCENSLHSAENSHKMEEHVFLAT